MGSNRYAEIEPLLFQRTDGDSCVAFRKDHKDHVTHLFLGTAAYKKVAWYETTVFQLGLIGFFVLVFLSACIVNLLPVLGFQLLHMPQSSQLLAGLISALNLVFLVGLALAVFKIDQWEFVYNVPTVLTALLAFPLVTTILTVGSPIFAARTWEAEYWSVIGRFHYALITLSALAFIPFLRYWNLLRFRFLEQGKTPRKHK